MNPIILALAIVVILIALGVVIGDVSDCAKTLRRIDETLHRIERNKR